MVETLPKSLVVNGGQICSWLVACNSGVVPRPSGNIAGAFGRHHASFEDAVLFVERLKIRLIFSNESTSRRLSIRGQEQMEALHFGRVPIELNVIQEWQKRKKYHVKDENQNDFHQKGSPIIAHTSFRISWMILKIFYESFILYSMFTHFFCVLSNQWI